MSFASALYFGQVMHKRLRPFGHRFVYRIFQLWLDLDELPKLGHRLRLFSHNRFNLFSFYDRDHGARDGGALRPWIEARLAEADIDLEGGAVRLLCFPRILGYVFNPLTLWFCHHRDGSLRAVLYEVRNTFGDKHGYLIPVEHSPGPGEALQQSCDKAFHVSPFIPMQARYRFRLPLPDARLSVVIRQSVPEGEQLVAVQSARRQVLSDRKLLRAFFTYPLLTLKVIGAIHWQALRLWLKGASFHRRPQPPVEAVSLVSQTPDGRHSDE
ncbi:DUF1365 domain-containing protein [Fodinicurvata fenggangensis]|uniref:DUF1365 domain-containing protein n=1 Tax=Fodinicurvata fenggangensis TaxID=1121830 RepID=UPI00047D40AB|nr:DUF1365 domain-containing protein [Fodinicurvata fenggangensis]